MLWLYEIENIDNTNVCTINVSPKVYFEKFKDRTVNKKHKEVKRNTRGMDFESYAEKFAPLREDCEKKEKRNIPKRLEVHNTKMKMTSVSKVRFASLNDKRYYFSDEIVSLLYGHPLLSEVRNAKKAFPKVQQFIEQEENNLLPFENKVGARNERLRVLRSIYAQPITYYKLNTSKTFVPNNNKSVGCFTSTNQASILNSRWL